MIYLLNKEDSIHSAKRLCKSLSYGFGKIHPLSYENIFYTGKVPGGHYIFSDFDRMSCYEIDCCIALTDSIRKQSPKSRILNDPRWTLERVPLLKKLHDQKLNFFDVFRIDTDSRPKKYPVFIRSEDGCLGPNTVLLNSPTEYDQAIQKMIKEGHTLKRKIAVEFCAQQDINGWYTKYGVLNICGSIIPIHIQRNKNWNVKSSGAKYDDEFCREELDWVKNFPHNEQIQNVFNLANIDYGRIDYTLVDGKVQTFEINTNPCMPRMNGKKDKQTDNRKARRDYIRKEFLEALTTIDSTSVPNKAIAFSLPKPIIETPRLPRKSLTGRIVQGFHLLSNPRKLLYYLPSKYSK